MSEYYRAVFSATKSGLSGVPLLDSVRDALREWIEGDFGPRAPSTNSPNAWTGAAGELSVNEHRLEDEGLAAFRMKWERPDPDDEAGRWRLSARLATEGDDVEVDIEVQGSENRRLGIRGEYAAKLPSVPARLLSEFDCALDGRRLFTKAERMAGEGWAASFIRDRLFAPERRIPLVVASENGDGRGVDADTLQENLLGLATVVSYDHRAAWDISRDIPRALRCYDGAVRLYSPGCAETDVAQQNPYWVLYDALRLQDAGILWLILRDECVNRVPRQTLRRLYTRTRRRIEARQNDEVIQTYESLLAENEANIDPELYEAYKSLEDPDTPPNPAYLVAYTRWARAFKNQNERMKIEKAQLESELERLKANGDARESAESETAIPPTPIQDAEPRQFKTVKDAVAQANGALDGLRFFPTAFESAERSQFRRPAEVYRAFEVLSECAKARGKGPLGKDLTLWLAERGVEYAPRESESTEREYRAERTFCDIYMPAHVKIGGSELRIHLSWDESAGKWLIGYVGPHLPTSRYDG